MPKIIRCASSAICSPAEGGNVSCVDAQNGQTERLGTGVHRRSAPNGGPVMILGTISRWQDLHCTLWSSFSVPTGWVVLAIGAANRT